jgi:hypothetical protein
MKKYAVIVLAICLATGFRYAPNSVSSSKSSFLPPCTCNTSQYNNCLGIMLYYTLTYDCSTGVPTGITAKDINNNPFTIHAFGVNTTDKTFAFAISHVCDVVYMGGSYWSGCSFTLGEGTCLPEGNCLVKK